MTCPNCKKRGKTWNGADPVCFEEDWINNWRCSTLDSLRGLIYYNQEYKCFNGITLNTQEDQSYSTIFIANIEINNNEDEFPAMLYLSWYKHRRRLENCYLLFNEKEPRRPTFSEIDIIIKHFHKIYKGDK